MITPLPRPLLVAGILTLLGGAAGAQAPFDVPPKRPNLGAQADTNSALAYYNHGISRLGVDPTLAAESFYWAARLDPAWAAPLYAQRTALLLARPPADLTLYLSKRSEALKKKDLDRIDSLAILALIKNPFVDRHLDGVLLSTWLARETDNQATLRDLGTYDRRFTAWAAYARGDYVMAAKVFGDLIRRKKTDPDLLFWRALTYFATGQLDSARYDLQASVSLQRQTEEELPGYGWMSHAGAEFAVGLLFGLTHQLDSAQSAYERALLDDIRLYPAHYQLGKIRLALGDTARAIAEYSQAVALAPADAGYLTDLGLLLVATGVADSGMRVLKRATDAEPYFAIPHFTLGIVFEQAGMQSEAAQHFERFLALAPRTMAPAIAAAQRHLATLKGAP